MQTVTSLPELFGVMGTELEKPAARFSQAIFRLQDSRVNPELDGGHRVQLGAHELVAIHTPGHSAGHCCFYPSTTGIVFPADLALSSFGPMYGYLDSETDPFISSMEKNISA